MTSAPRPHLAAPRRPISRRILVALFLLMTIPMVGWYFVGDFTARGLVDALPGAQRETVVEIQRQVRFKLAVVLGASIAALGGVILYLRRTVLDRLEDLARQTRQARGARGGPVFAAVELTEPDEIGDLARALSSALSRLEERAREASRFADDLGHELRTPLAAIRGAAELLAEPDLSAAERHRFTQHVLAESQRLERLVEGLLALARAEARESAAPAPPLELGKALDDIARSIEPLAAAAGVRLVVIARAELPPIALDSDLLRRTLVPVIENAIRHSPAGGEVHLLLERRDDFALVAIEDRGPGVPAELRERIFERFFSSAAETEHAGAGLGLAIARRAADRLGGRIWVEDAAAGGARFVLGVLV